MACERYAAQVELLVQAPLVARETAPALKGGTAINQFNDGMTLDAVALDRLLATRERMMQDIQSRLHGAPADFLRSLNTAEPDFSLIGLPQGADLRAVQWKRLNLAQLEECDPAKHVEQARAHDAALGLGRAR